MLTTTTMMRLFFAIQLSPAVITLLSEIIDGLNKEPWGSRVRWSNPNNLHIVLRFLGNLDPRKVSTLIHHSKRLISSISCFNLTVDAIKLFPSPTAPRAIVAQILPTTELFDLAYALEESATYLNFSPESKPYLPHLILGRLNNFIPPLKEEIKCPILPMQVDKIVLLNTEKEDESFRYHLLHMIPLQLK